MRSLASVIATAGGIGFLRKGGGTAAAVAFCIAWWLLPMGYAWQAVLLIVLLAAGVWSASKMETVWEHDSSRIVIDEVAGMMISVAFLPHTPGVIVTGLILFRFFDILKPLGIGRAELLPRGWGVMGDDVLAGVYSQILVRVLVMTQLL
ncbi:phosphatidylglycerophosphatase A [Paraflavitalea pollutisoli]|uniref:phosphatidylglycerophosphatase A family protein n=1 Tax=Paraflavitalea pollutisoli TaxID=3034143 RepID=UPI0023EBC99F|nr:phosphatidylglycerophosphatase A [Paraflavitalea sp. H1-2-19X]